MTCLSPLKIRDFFTRELKCLFILKNKKQNLNIILAIIKQLHLFQKKQNKQNKKVKFMFI